MSDDLFARIAAFLFGACIGSFLNVCIGRWPAERSVVRPRSRCPFCGHQLAWFENIPLVSWVALRARCRCCDEPISVQYPLVELVVALGWTTCVAQFGPTLTAIRVAVVGTVLLGVAITDAKHYLIPDGFTVFGLFFALAMAILAIFTGDNGPFAGAYDALIGACAGAGIVAIVGWLGEVALKKEAMGMGDVTLMAFVGAVVGPPRAILTVFVGAALGAVSFLFVVYPLARMRRARLQPQHELQLGAAGFEAPLVPFGVFLAPAALVTLLWGDALFAWLLRG
ncbi:MAG TPA: prepilin peptidase [Gemmatimonadaceae bacterium]|jgi:leader peptidase (prepilin peptidase)/N-methyltransferase|nr:prepilin peptidase [Gemmatimonadaceae bacterium]